MNTKVCLKYPVNDILWRQFLTFYPPDPFKLDLFDSFCNSKAFDTVLTLNLSNKFVKVHLNVSYYKPTFPLFFNEFQIWY